MKKRAYHHGDLRNAIIQEATARARVSGEKAIVLREIAPHIGVSATAAYRHFANRQQLVEEVAALGFVEMKDRLENLVAGGVESDPVLAAYRELREAALAIVGFAIDEPAWARTMMENLGSSETVATHAGDINLVLQAIIERGIEAGAFRPGTVMNDELPLWAAMDGLSAQALFGIRPMRTPEALDSAARTIDLCLTDMLTDAGLRVRDTAFPAVSVSVDVKV
ncbi:TetR/AcrR family transcriptional regulator [Dietzia cinnamea]|uniref:TetR/AcrR family transcriptional regulator n=1 Tax=Dietzia cinnamea TaxID=321318 RepID=UPI000D08F477|nr:TetR/AcrR family transcriptional regulator [Dietzia cinnamea]AVM64604.1 TetR/AcrR family transcriptional regulator [Dietzia sp. oral taxon 368]MCT2274145.1 TetR/AcrR family transcriptional regulator [Dietzia cinnamea]